MAQATNPSPQFRISIPYWLLILATSVVSSGCAQVFDRVMGVTPQAPVGEITQVVAVEDYEHEARNLKFSQDEEPEIHQARHQMLQPPDSIAMIPDSEVWHMTLLEAIFMAMNQNTMIPVDSEFLGNGTLMTNPESAASVFDPAIQQAGVQGNRGVDAAESDFIPLLSSQMIYGQDENYQNNIFSGGLAAGDVLEENTNQFALLWQKQTHLGGDVSIRHDVNYDENNAPSRLFPSAYNSQLSFDLTQPLFQGAGREFTDIAGPRSFISQRSPVMDQGIVISRINEELSQQQFQQVLQRLVKDVTNVYWDLYFAHRQFDIETRAHNNAHTVWKKAEAKLNLGLGSGAADEAQAHESYLSAKARMEEAQSQVALVETRFRRLLNIPINDLQLIKPFDTPKSVAISEEWIQILTNAYGHRYELQATKLNVRSLELQLQAAHSYSKPRLDFVGNFRTNGFGDKLFTDTDSSPEVKDSSYDSLTGLDQTGWSAGVVMSFPTNPQLQETLIRQLELRLAKVRAALSAQEWEITRELTHAYKSAERWYRLIQTNEERVAAARKQVNALDAAFPTGKISIDLLTRAQSTLAQAESEYERALSEYNKALAELDFRQGIILNKSQITILGDANFESWMHE